MGGTVLGTGLGAMHEVGVPLLKFLPSITDDGLTL